jgi:hypothetical protein
MGSAARSARLQRHADPGKFRPMRAVKRLLDPDGLMNH